MYQMAPGQPQPVFFPAVPGQPNMSPQCQGGQHYVSGGGQPVQQVQMAQPVRGQWFPGHPPHRDPDMSPIQFNNVYMKSPLGATRIVEFFTLIVAGACIIAYSNKAYGVDGRGNFFRGVTIFSWVMVTMYQMTYMFGLNKSKICFGQPSNLTLVSCGFQILLTILMISCSGSLTVRAQELQIWFSDAYDTKTYYPNNYGNKKTSIADVQRSNAMLIYAALAFGYITSLLFLGDILLLIMMFRKERAQEAGGGTILLVQPPGTNQQQQSGVVSQQAQQFGMVAQPQAVQQQFGVVAQPHVVDQQQRFGVVAEPPVLSQPSQQGKTEN